MAIQITANIVVTKAQLRDAGINPDTDETITGPVADYLKARLPHGWNADVNVDVTRKVKAPKN